VRNAPDASSLQSGVMEFTDYQGDDRVGNSVGDEAEAADTEEADTEEAGTDQEEESGEQAAEAPVEEPAMNETEEASPGLVAADSPENAATGPEGFYEWYLGLAAATLFLLGFYYRRMDGEQLEILKMLVVSVVPLAVLTMSVLGAILFGITTATESAGIGSIGAMFLAGMQKYRRITLWAGLVGTR
jgi:TRAP-type mannitol/chloroaromatic compound transport system permease large subunit